MHRRLVATGGKPQGKDDETPPNAASGLAEFRERKAMALFFLGRHFYTF
jgi:hypothetical protein